MYWCFMCIRCGQMKLAPKMYRWKRLRTGNRSLLQLEPRDPEFRNLSVDLGPTKSKLPEKMPFRVQLWSTTGVVRQFGQAVRSADIVRSLPQPPERCLCSPLQISLQHLSTSRTRLSKTQDYDCLASARIFEATMLSLRLHIYPPYVRCRHPTCRHLDSRDQRLLSRCCLITVVGIKLSAAPEDETWVGQGNGSIHKIPNAHSLRSQNTFDVT